MPLPPGVCPQAPPRGAGAAALMALIAALAGGAPGCGDPPLPARSGAGASAPDVAALGRPEVVARPEPATPTAAADASSPAEIVEAGPARLGPPYPVVLAHGFFGADAFAGLDFATYFHGVRADLQAHGEPWVFTPAVDPFNASEVRGAQLLAAVEAALAQTGHAKVVLIGHSQGGLDARFVASQRPDLVAAVVTFSTPHRGSPIAAVALGLVPWPSAQQVVDALLKLVGGVVWRALDDDSSLVAAVKQLTPAALDAFNAAHPDQPGVAYYALAGRSALSDGKPDCAPDLLVDFVVAYDNVRDPLDAAFLATREIVDGGLGKTIPHDGLVRVKDARWGTFLGCVPADHLDEIGHLLGDSPGLGNSFDHKAFYRAVVGFLRAQGF
jgi:triacylglycerol lipase